MGVSKSKLEESPILSDLSTHAKKPIVTITPEISEFFKKVEKRANKDKLVQDFMSKMNDDVIKAKSDPINILIRQALEFASDDDTRKMMIIELSKKIGVKNSKISNYAASDNTEIQRSFFKIFSEKLYTFYDSMKNASTFSKTLWDIGKHPITKATYATINIATTGNIGAYPMTILCNIPEIKIGPIDAIPRLGCLVFLGLAFMPLLKTPADYFFWGANNMGISSVSSSYEATTWATKFLGYTLARQAFNDKQIEAITPLVEDILTKIGDVGVSAYNTTVHVIKLANQTLEKGSTIVSAIIDAVDYANNNMDLLSEKITVAADTANSYIHSNIVTEQIALQILGSESVKSLKQISNVGFIEAMKQKGQEQLAIGGVGSAVGEITGGEAYLLGTA